MFSCQIQDNDLEIEWGYVFLEFQIRLPEEIGVKMGLKFPLIEWNQLQVSPEKSLKL